MAEAKRLKSHVEIALERFSKADAENGLDHVPLTDAQKVAIAEIRNFYEARVAEIEVLYNGRQMTGDPVEQTAREEEHRRDRARLSSERDAKIEKVRRGETP